MALAAGLTLGAAVAMILLTIMLRPKATDEQKPATHRVGLVDEDEGVTA